MEWVVTVRGRLDQFLAREMKNVSRSRIQRVIVAGGVTVNGTKVRKVSTNLPVGHRVTFDDSALKEVARDFIEPVDLHLTVLYEDDACMVIDKPAGIPVHPGAGTLGRPTVLHGIAFLFEKRRLPFSTTSTLAHRLDKDTTGCLLVAKCVTAHATLQEEFAERTVSKTYLALVAGVPASREAMIDADIGRSTHQKTRMSVFGASGSREASTGFRTLAISATKDVSLLQCMPQTGRTHQIRVHLRAIGHPILGDATYGTEKSRDVSETHGLKSLMLHAWKLAFVSPGASMRIEVTAPLPKAFGEALLNRGILWPV